MLDLPVIDEIEDAVIAGDSSAALSLLGKIREELATAQRERDEMQSNLTKVSQRFREEIFGRKRYAETLHQSEQKYHSLFEIIDEGFALCELVRDSHGIAVDYRVLEINPALEKLTCFTSAEVVGRLRTDINPIRDKRMLEMCVRVVETGKPARFEQYNDGFDRWFSIGLFPQSGDLFAELFMDITTLKRTEVALRRSEEQYRLLFENMRDAFFLAEPVYDDAGRPVDWKFLDANAAYTEMTGFQRDQVVGHLNSELFPGAEPVWYEMVARVAETGEPENLESYSGFTGRWYSVRYYSPRSGITAAITSDITHNKISEEVLRESEDRYRTISQLTSDFAFSFHISPEGQPIVDWTAGAIESISGYTIEEMPTFEQWAEVIHPDDLNQLREKIMYQMFRGGDLQVDVCLTAKDGEQRWLHVITKAVRDGAGKVVRINGAAQNITERHRLEEKITLLRREQEAFLRHEMKNLFAPIQLFAELVLDSENLTMNQTYYLQRIVETSKRVGEFIDALKRIQDIENGRYILNRVRQSLNSIIKRAIQNLEPLAKKSGVFIRLQEHEEEAVLLLDPNLMPGVFTNLIQNAIEHVTGLKKSEERIVTVGLTREKNRYAVCIHNWGAPIPPERVNTFFEMFNVGPEKKGGTGLGTTYAWLVTKAHGGSITVKSNVEEGTTVRVELPLR